MRLTDGVGGVGFQPNVPLSGSFPDPLSLLVHALTPAPFPLPRAHPCWVSWSSRRMCHVGGPMGQRSQPAWRGASGLQGGQAQMSPPT